MNTMKVVPTSGYGRRLIAGLTEALAHARGEIELPSYTVTVPDRMDVAKLRRSLGLSQAAFARAIRLRRDRDPCVGAGPAPAKAQENTPVLRTERRRSPTTGQSYPWIVRRSAMVNNYYIYAVDRDFGPFFLKFCSYFPFNAKLAKATAATAA
jgi:hypothetical protein